MAEITPSTKSKGIFRYGNNNRFVKKFKKSVEARAVIEG